MSVLAIETVDIIHQLSPHKEISLSPGDTIVAKVDIDEYGIEYANLVHKMLEKAFPYNTILILDKRTELEVYRYEH